MELEQKVAMLEKRLKKQGRVLGETMVVLLLAIGFFVTRWAFGLDWHRDLQGTSTGYVSPPHDYYNTSTIRPWGIELESYSLRTNSKSKYNQATASLVTGPAAATLSLSSKGSTSNVSLYTNEEAGQGGLEIRGGESSNRDQNTTCRGSILLYIDKGGPKLLLLDGDGTILFKAP